MQGQFRRLHRGSVAIVSIFKVSWPPYIDGLGSQYSAMVCMQHKHDVHVDGPCNLCTRTMQPEKLFLK